jgi:hypothetical protein
LVFRGSEEDQSALDDEDHSLRSDLLRDRSSLAEIKGGGVGLYSLADESGGKTLA